MWTLSAGNNCVAGVQSAMAIAAEEYSLANVLIVSATNSDDALASFSNFVSPTGLGRWIAAPGGVSVAPIGNGTVGVWSTYVTSCFGTFSCGTYAPASGTSMSAPIVAGVAALVRSRHPAKTASEVVDCMVTGSYRRTRAEFVPHLPFVDLDVQRRSHPDRLGSRCCRLLPTESARPMPGSMVSDCQHARNFAPL